MNKINTKKKVVVKRVKGKRVEQTAKQLDYFVQKNTFDKDLSAFYNYKGLTYVLNNPAEEVEDEIDVEIKSKQVIDNDLKARYFAGLSQAEIAAIEEVKEEYNL